MKYIPDKHRRRSIRLRVHDYGSPGVYFVTICSKNRECIFGEIVDGEMRPNDVGETVRACWEEVPAHFPHIRLDGFVVMPNHVHGIIVLKGMPDNQVATCAGADQGDADQEGAACTPANQEGAACCAPTNSNDNSSNSTNKPTPGSLSAVIRSFKSAATKRINKLWGCPSGSVWQRNFYERVLRDKNEFLKAKRYIAGNPSKWEADRENPAVYKKKNNLDTM